MVFLVRERGAENTDKKKKTDRRKTLKNEEKEIWKIKRNSNKHLWFYLLYKEVYFGWKSSLKKSILIHHILVITFMVAEYLKRSNDTKFNIHYYKNYNIIELHLNWLSTTTQIFIARIILDIDFREVPLL